MTFDSIRVFAIQQDQMTRTAATVGRIQRLDIVFGIELRHLLHILGTNVDLVGQGEPVGRQVADL